MKKFKDLSKSRIPKAKAEVKGSAAMAAWLKEKSEGPKEGSLKGKNITDYGEYRVFFTRPTLLKDYANLDYKEKLLRLVIELYRSKKTNIAYPPFRMLEALTGMSKDTLIRTIKSSEIKKVFKVERRSGQNNVYRFL